MPNSTRIALEPGDAVCFNSWGYQPWAVGSFSSPTPFYMDNIWTIHVFGESQMEVLKYTIIRGMRNDLTTRG
jgi:hypothetical protein